MPIYVVIVAICARCFVLQLQLWSLGLISYIILSYSIYPMATASKATTPVITKKTGHHTFRNFMILILIAAWLWSWFNYLPDQAVSTMESLRAAASRQIDSWIWVSEPVQVINEPYVINPSIDLMTGDSETIMSGEILSGDMMSGDIDSSTISAWWSADQEMMSGDTATGTDLWNQLDATSDPSSTTETPDTSTNTTEPSPIKPLTDKIINIEIGWQIVTIDGTPEEDIIINAGSYRVIVQKK